MRNPLSDPPTSSPTRSASPALPAPPSAKTAVGPSAAVTPPSPAADHASKKAFSCPTTAISRRRAFQREKFGFSYKQRRKRCKNPRAPGGEQQYYPRPFMQQRAA